MKAADPPPPTVDPNFAAEQQQATQSNLDQMQIQAQQDTAAILARYGTQKALANVAAPASFASSAPSVSGRF